MPLPRRKWAPRRAGACRHGHDLHPSASQSFPLHHHSCKKAKDALPSTKLQAAVPPQRGIPERKTELTFTSHTQYTQNVHPRAQGTLRAFRSEWWPCLGVSLFFPIPHSYLLRCTKGYTVYRAPGVTLRDLNYLLMECGHLLTDSKYLILHQNK